MAAVRPASPVPTMSTEMPVGEYDPIGFESVYPSWVHVLSFLLALVEGAGAGDVLIVRLGSTSLNGTTEASNLLKIAPIVH